MRGADLGTRCQPKLGTRFLALALQAPVLLALASMGLAQDKAQPAPVLADLNPGEGWRELSLRPANDLSARAWSDPAAGCHLVSFQLPIPATAQIEPLMERFANTLAKAELSIADVQGTGDGRQVSLAGESLVGIANLQLQRQSPTEGSSSAILLACYWNDREPDHCNAICQRVLERMPSQGPR